MVDGSEQCMVGISPFLGSLRLGMGLWWVATRHCTDLRVRNV